MLFSARQHLLLERIAEYACQDTWRNIRDDLKQVQLALLSSPNGRVWQVTEPSPDAANRLRKLKIKGSVRDSRWFYPTECRSNVSGVSCPAQCSIKRRQPK